MATSIQRPSSVVSSEHGRLIFAWCNIRTHQVLYSLSAEKEDRILSQLPDLGANNKPPTIRPDLWKPLWTLKLPKSFRGYQRGLDIFGELRAWRMMHEYNTAPPPGNDKLWSKEQIDELQKKLDEKGGSKRTTVWKLISREKKKARAKNVMNQKANSIADLAAVLLHHEQDGTRMFLEDGTKTFLYWTTRTRRREVESMVRRCDSPELYLHSHKQSLGKLSAGQVDASASAEVQARIRLDRRSSASDMVLTRDCQGLVKTARLRLYLAQVASPMLEQLKEEGNSTLRKVETTSGVAGVADVQSDNEPAQKETPLTSRLIPHPDVQEELSPEKAIRYLEGLRWAQRTEYSPDHLKYSTRKKTGELKTTGDAQDTAGELSQDAIAGLETPAATDHAAAEKLTYEQSSGVESTAATDVGQLTRFSRVIEDSRIAISEIEAKLEAADEQAAQELRTALSRRHRDLELTLLDLESISWKNFQEDPTALSYREEDALELSPYLPSPSLASIPVDALPRKIAARAQIKSLLAPPFPIDGATVKWQNMLDAEYAEKWPESIEHDEMGRDPPLRKLLRHIPVSEREKFRMQYKALMQAETADAKGDHEAARKLRDGVDMIIQNEEGDYELVSLVERSAWEDPAVEPGDEETLVEAEDERVPVKADQAPGDKAASRPKTIFERVSSLLPLGLNKSAERPRAP